MKQLLMSSNYFVLNKQLIKFLGIETAFLLTALIEVNDNLSDDDGWFYRTSSSLEEETGLSNHKQTTCINKLIELGILEQENKGNPCRRFFRISFEKIEELVFKKTETSFEEIQKPVFKKLKNLTLSNNINNNNLNKELINKELNNIYMEVVNYLNLKLGTNYRANSKQTKSFINARLKEKFTLEDFKLVIDKKCDEWLGTEMEKYLRPETLFGTKFESYLNSKIIIKTNQNSSKHDEKIKKLEVEEDYLKKMKERYGL